MNYKDSNFLSFCNIVLDFTYFLTLLPNKNNLSLINGKTKKEMPFTIQSENPYEFGRKISEIVYEHLHKGKIILASEHQNYDFTFTPISFESKITPNNNLIDLLSEIMIQYQNSFLSEKQCIHFQEKAKNFLKSYKEIIEYNHVFQIPNETLTNYLKSYYDLLTNFVCSKDYYFEISHDIYNQFIDSLLYQDTIIKNNILYFTFSHPICLKNIQDFYLEIGKYQKEIQTTAIEKSIHIIYKDILIKKLKKNFSWNVIFQNELKSASLQNGDYVTTTNLKNNNALISFSMIYDSIWKQLKEDYQNQKITVYSISIIGELENINMQELTEKLNQKCQENNMSITCQIHSYHTVTLFNKNYLNQILLESDTCYIFEDNNCYQYLIKEQNDNMQDYVFREYTESLKKVWENFNMTQYKKIPAFYECNYYIQFKQEIISFLENKKPVHFFYHPSSSESNITLYNLLHNDFLVRKYSNHMIETIINTKQKNHQEKNQQFLFSLSEFYRNLISDDAYFQEFQLENKLLLDSVICIDYRNPNTANYDCFYTNPNHQNVEFLKKSIDNRFLGLFQETKLTNNKRTPLQEALYSSLYNLSTNFDELLFSNMLCGMNDSNNNIIPLAFLKNSGVIENVIAKAKKDFLYKNLYDLWIPIFNISSDSYTQQLLLEYWLSNYHLEDKKDFLDIILKSCHNFDLNQSYLKKNTQKIKSK